MHLSIKNLLWALPAAALLSTGCSKEYQNPNAAPEELVFTNSKGMMAAAIGLQRTYTLGQASTQYGLQTATGFLTNEVTLRNAGNIPELQFSTGGSAVDGTNTVIANLWINSNKIIYDANRIQAAAQTLGDKGYASGLIAYSTVMEALSWGVLSMYWERIPDTVGVANSTFSPRATGYRKAVAAIDVALATIAANPISTGFNSDLPAGHNLINTLQALKARYALFAGDNAIALTAANAVDLTATPGRFTFDAASPNPIFSAVTSTNNVYQPVDSTLGLPAALAPDLADRRIPFYTAINTTVVPRYRLTGFYTAATSAIPLYYGGEMTLIKAEVLARNGDLVNAAIELNKVVTKSSDPLGLGAQLPPVAPASQQDMLDQIYRNRCIELFQSGLKMEDMRRFGRPNSEKKRNLLPYPFRERDNNSNTPPDPAF